MPKDPITGKNKKFSKHVDKDYNEDLTEEQQL